MKLPKLPEILEIGSGSRREVAAAGRPGQQLEGIRKEKSGLLHDYIATETGPNSVYWLRPLSLTPNSKLQTLANKGP